MTDWFRAKILGRIRVSTLALIVAFAALFWVHETFTPEPAPPDTRARGRAAGLRTRSQLHLGAADQCATAQGADVHHHHDNHHDHDDQPD